MDSNKKNLIWFLFYLLNSILLIFWGSLIFWLIKSHIIWNPLMFLLIFIPILFLIIIPLYFFIRSTVKLARSFKIKERFKISKKYFLASFFIAFLFWALSILAFVLYFFPNAQLYNYDDGPYLLWNDDPKTTMTIIWHTKTPSESVVGFGESIGDMETFRISALEKRHIVKLSNLKPGTLYHYKITDFSAIIYNFTTAPSTITPFNFTAIGDTHAGLDPSEYGAVIDAMAPYQYDFIIHAGDLGPFVGEKLEGWHPFFNYMEEHANIRPYMVSIGNHEYGVDIFARNFKYFFPYNYVEDWGHYYSFDYSNAHFVMIDVFQNQLDWGGFLLEAQEAWLRKDLALNKNKWLFVVLHAPPYSTGDFNMHQKLSTQLAPIFYENQVDIVLSGHDHHYEAFWTNRTESWGGTYFFVTGGGGGDLDEFIMTRDLDPWKNLWHNASIEAYQNDYITRNHQIYGELAHHFMHFELNGNNLHIKAIRDNGSLIQEFNITK